jgi:hypothetical protein
VAPASVQAKVRGLIAQHGVVKAARMIRCSRLTTTAIIAGLPVNSGSVLKADLALGA